MLAAMSVNPLAGLSGCNKPVQAAKETTRDGLMNNDQLSLTNPRDALRTCWKQTRWTLNAINLRPNYLTALRTESRQLSAFNLPHLHLAPPGRVLSRFSASEN